MWKVKGNPSWVHSSRPGRSGVRLVCAEWAGRGSRLCGAAPPPPEKRPVTARVPREVFSLRRGAREGLSSLSVPHSLIVSLDN